MNYGNVGSSKNEEESGVPFKNEEESIFGFFKRYIGLLATVGGIPLVANAFNILKPPTFLNKGVNSQDGAISGLASLLCIVTLSICVFCRNLLADCAYESIVWRRLIPVYWATLFLLGGGALISVHLCCQDKILPGWNMAIYLSILPCLTAALGIILMASYAQFYGSELEKTIDRVITTPQDRIQIRQLIVGYSKLLDTRQSSGIAKLSRELSKNITFQINGLTAGEIRTSGNGIIEVQRTLLKQFGHNLHAVSDRDVRFWLRGVGEIEESGNSRLAKDYLRLHCDFASDESCFCRIFILDDGDLENSAEGIVKVLKMHSGAKIGWALIPYEELHESARDPKANLDFALFGDGSALAFFTTRGAARSLKVILQNANHSQTISEYKEKFNILANSAWVCNANFSSKLKIPDTLLPDAIEDQKLHDHALKFGQGNIVRVGDSDKEIREGVEFVRKLRRKNMVYWGEFSTKYVNELVGKWTYSVVGNDADNKRFTHLGDCVVVICGRNLVMEGVRRKTLRMDSLGELVDKDEQSVLWVSSPLEFRQRESGPEVEFKYSINVNGEETRGICRCKSPLTESTLNGDLWLISETNTVRAAIAFDKVQV